MHRPGRTPWIRDWSMFAHSVDTPLDGRSCHRCRRPRLSSHWRACARRKAVQDICVRYHCVGWYLCKFTRSANIVLKNISTQVLTVFACFIVLLAKVTPRWGDVFLGYIPSGKLFDTQTDVLYIGALLVLRPNSRHSFSS